MLVRVRVCVYMRVGAGGVRETARTRFFAVLNNCGLHILRLNPTHLHLCAAKVDALTRADFLPNTAYAGNSDVAIKMIKQHTLPPSWATADGGGAPSR